MQIISEVEQLLVTDPGTTKDKEKRNIHDIVKNTFDISSP